MPNKSIIDQAQPVLQGQASAQREPDRLQRRQLAAGDLPARPAGRDGLRRRRYPARVVCGGRQKYGVNKGQFWVKPQLGISYLAFNHDRRCSRAPRAPTSRRRSTTRSTARRCSPRAVTSAGKRTDQILPPGIAGFRDANLYPLKGPDIATAKKWAAKAGVKTGPSIEYYTSNTGSAPLAGADLPVQPEADRPQREHATCSPVPCRSTRKAPVVSRSTSRPKAGSPTTPIRTTSSTCCSSGDNLHDSNNNNVAYFNDPTFNKQMTAAALLSGAKRYTTYGNLDVYDDEARTRRGRPATTSTTGSSCRRRCGLLHLQRDLQRRSRGGLPQVGRRRTQAAGAQGRSSGHLIVAVGTQRTWFSAAEPGCRV